MVKMEKIDSLKKEYKEVLEELSNPELLSNWEKFEELSKKKVELEKIIEKIEEIENIKKEINENKAILNADEDPEFSSLARQEIASLTAKLKLTETELEKEMNPTNKEGSTDEPVIIEIRGGTGGGEAALFAANLFRMYSRYAQIKGWKQKILDSHRTEIDGIKEIIFELKGKDVFSCLRYEGGVHRVQRIPETEKNGRIHTSTATVAVMPCPKKAQIKINPAELRIDVFRSSGPGGQNVMSIKGIRRLD